MAVLKRAGGFRCDAQAKARVLGALWLNGSLSRDLIAKDADVFAERGSVRLCTRCQVLHGYTHGVGMTIHYPVRNCRWCYCIQVADFVRAKVQEVLDHEGMGTHAVFTPTTTGGRSSLPRN